MSIDITELSGYHYHTGIVFNGYINSETQPLVRGGRFDGMHTQATGELPREATGFSMDISRLLAHIELESGDIVVVHYDDMTTATSEQLQHLHSQVTELRQQGYRVTMPLNAQDCPKNISHRLGLIKNNWQLIAIL